MNYFLKSASCSEEVDFLIFTDADLNGIKNYKNVKYFNLSLQNFNKLANEKIAIASGFQVANGYKLCDIKPMYGQIFQEYLLEYSAWAHGDIDMFMGNFMPDLRPLFDGEIDVISSHPQYISGAFTAYRNVAEINSLFMHSKDYQKVLTTSEYVSFDEASDVMPKLWDGCNIFDFPSHIESITHLVMNNKYGVRAKFLPLIVERVQGEVRFDKGQLFDETGEIKIFHFLIYKNNISFNVPVYKGEHYWIFTKYGIFNSSFTKNNASLFISSARALFKKAYGKFIKYINKYLIYY